MENLKASLKGYDLSIKGIEELGLETLKEVVNELTALFENFMDRKGKELAKSLREIIRTDRELDVFLSGSQRHIEMRVNFDNTNQGIALDLNRDPEDPEDNRFTIESLKDNRRIDMDNLNPLELAVIDAMHTILMDAAVRERISAEMESIRKTVKEILDIRHRYLQVKFIKEREQSRKEHISEANKVQTGFINTLKSLGYIPEQIRLRIYDNPEKKEDEVHFLYRGKQCVIWPDTHGKWERDSKGKRMAEVSFGAKVMWAMAEHLRYPDGTKVFGDDFYK